MPDPRTSSGGPPASHHASAVSPRAILHVDMDAFFASIVQLDHPETRGRPVLTGGSGPRGVISTASYEARAFGCRSAMPTAAALRLCPHAIIRNPAPGRIRACSDAVFEILHEFSPLVQPLSSDEAFVDVTGSVRLLGEPVGMARAIRERIRERVGLTASVGVAHNKFLAKLASDLEKPDGLTVVDPSRVHELLDPLPVSRLWGVGDQSVARLARLGIRTIGDMRAMPLEVLTGWFGPETAEHYWRLSRGLDDRPVLPDHEAKSISHEQTFGENLRDAEAVRGVIMQQAEAVSRRLRRHQRLAGTVVVKIRFGDFQTVTRRATVHDASGAAAPTDRTDVIWSLASELFDRWCAEPAGFRSVRLIGVGVGSLTAVGGETGAGGEQALLFRDTDQLGRDVGEKQRRLDAATDAIAAKFGSELRGGEIARARGVGRPRKRRLGEDQFGPGS